MRSPNGWGGNTFEGTGRPSTCDVLSHLPENEHALDEWIVVDHLDRTSKKKELLRTTLLGGGLCHEK